MHLSRGWLRKRLIALTWCFSLVCASLSSSPPAATVVRRARLVLTRSIPPSTSSDAILLSATAVEEADCCEVVDTPISAVPPLSDSLTPVTEEAEEAERLRDCDAALFALETVEARRWAVPLTDVLALPRVEGELASLVESFCVSVVDCGRRHVRDLRDQLTVPLANCSSSVSDSRQATRRRDRD